MSSPRRLLVIANPISGGGRSKVLVPRLCEALRARGLAAEPYFTTCAGDATARARAAGSEPWDGLVACGGDGTVNEVLNGMPDPTRPLAMLPVGTANVLAMELRLPRRPEALADLLATGTTRELAIGTANSRSFLLFCGAGLDGAVVQRCSETRTGTLGKLKWLPPILHTVRRWPQFSLRATFADGTVLDGLSAVLVTRVRNYGGVIHLPAGIDAGDGLLHALCFRTRSRLGWAWQGLRGLLRCMRQSGQLTVVPTTGLRIEGDAPFQLDGDFGGRAPVELGLRAQRARVFAPAAGARAPAPATRDWARS